MTNDPFAKLGAIDQKLFQKSSEKTQGERVNSTSVAVRPYGRTATQRYRRRYPFEFYQDQLDWLQKRSLAEKERGEPGSKSQMVREALDAYIAQKNLEEK